MMFQRKQQPFNTQAFMATILQWLKVNTGLDDEQYHGRGIYMKNDNGPESPVYPFATYDWVQSHTRLPFTHNTTNEIFEMTLSFEAHGRNANDANDLAQELYSLLNSYHFDDYAMAHDVAVVDVSNIMSTTNFISIQEERSFGFNVVLRTVNHFDDGYTPIDKVQTIQIKTQRGETNDHS